MFKVRYTHLLGYGVSRTFPTREAAQELIDVNAMIQRLPNCELIDMTPAPKPYLAQLQEARDNFCRTYLDGAVSHAQWLYQWALYCALIDRHLADINAAFRP